MATTVSPVASTGVPAATSAVGGASSPATTAPATQPVVDRNPTGFDAGSASGGGLAEQFGQGIGAIAAYAQSQMSKVQSNITSLFNSEGGQLDAAKLSVFNNQMSTYELMMEQAAKLQEKQDRAQRVWVQP